jgi:hypothetical protein
MKMIAIQRHYDKETDTYIEDRWYQCASGLYRELSRPIGLPETRLWTRLTASLNQ